MKALSYFYGSENSTCSLSHKNVVVHNSFNHGPIILTQTLTVNIIGPYCYILVHARTNNILRTGSPV